MPIEAGRHMRVFLCLFLASVRLYYHYGDYGGVCFSFLTYIRCVFPFVVWTRVTDVYSYRGSDDMG